MTIAIVWRIVRRLMSIAAILIVLVGCQSETASTPTATPVDIVRQVATLAPTATLSETDRIATQSALPLTPSPAAPTAIPSPTVYVGIFIGEIAFDPLAPVTRLDPAALPVPAVEPTLPGVRLLCQIAPDPVFGEAWRAEPAVNNALRCPIQVSFGFEGAVQVFERGVMYLRPETTEVWAIAPGAGGESGRYWYVGRAPEAGAAQPSNVPPGLFAPEGALANVWLTVPQVREALGFGLQPVEAHPVNVQRYDSGTLILDEAAGQVFALLLDGTAYGPYEGVLPEQAP
ncbi:MAG: hypothetical protein ACOCX3_02530 [Chloroflexota bacterium]